jgi:hypothetical protein
VVRNNLKSEEIISVVKLSSIISPIKIPPAALTINVPYGSLVPNSWDELIDIM